MGESRALDGGRKDGEMKEAGHTAVVPPPCCGNDDHDNQPGAVKMPTDNQEGNRRPHGAANLPEISNLNQTKNAESISGRPGG